MILAVGRFQTGTASLNADAVETPQMATTLFA
jgi:hypothetical protein